MQALVDERGTILSVADVLGTVNELGARRGPGELFIESGLGRGPPERGRGAD